MIIGAWASKQKHLFEFPVPTILQFSKTVGMVDANIGFAMKNQTRKSTRSDLFTSLNLVWPTNRLRTARVDFWGAIALVCTIGMVAKLAQTWLSH
jgi:hypothetical protein